jgi:hypothetical protein
METTALQRRAAAASALPPRARLRRPGSPAQLRRLAERRAAGRRTAGGRRRGAGGGGVPGPAGGRPGVALAHRRSPPGRGEGGSGMAARHARGRQASSSTLGIRIGSRPASVARTRRSSTPVRPGQNAGVSIDASTRPRYEAGRYITAYPMLVKRPGSSEPMGLKPKVAAGIEPGQDFKRRVSHTAASIRSVRPPMWVRRTSFTTRPRQAGSAGVAAGCVALASAHSRA